MSGPGFLTRERLFHAQGGECHWCGQPMILAKGCPAGRNDPRFCTSDHVVDRVDAKRRSTQVVAACYECNNNRNTKKHRDMPFEERCRRGLATQGGGSRA